MSVTLLQRIGLALLMAGVLAGTPVWAQDACRSGWPVSEDRARLADSALPAVQSGTRVDLSGEIAVRLDLRPWPAAALPHSPERKPASADSFAGHLMLTGAGMVQVTLSDAAWVDLFADGKPVPPASFTSVHDCPGVRKSLRFRLPDTPTSLVLQISGADRPALGIVLRRLP